MRAVFRNHVRYAWILTGANRSAVAVIAGDFNAFNFVIAVALRAAKANCTGRIELFALFGPCG